MPADFIHARDCKPKCEKLLTLPARDEMRELLTVKANIDRLLNMDTKAAEKENEHGQR